MVLLRFERLLVVSSAGAGAAAGSSKDVWPAGQGALS
jgi:hypothetical protein